MLKRFDDSNLSPVAVMVIFGGLAIGALIYGVQLWRRGKATLRWRPAKGQIVWSMLDERERERLGVSTGRTVYKADIRYRYTVGTTEYEGTREYFGFDFGGSRYYELRLLAEAQLEKYPVGRELRVYHDPANPAESVLVRGKTAGSLPWLAGGVGMALIDLVLLKIQFFG